MDLKEKAKQLKVDIPAVYLSLKDSDTPLVAKMLASITVCYALSPIDLIPDFVPVLGHLDDLIVLLVLVTLTIKLIPGEVWERNRINAMGMWQDRKPKKWVYAIPIILIWVLVFVGILKVIKK